MSTRNEGGEGEARGRGHLQGGGDPVRDEVPDAGENAPRDDDAVDDRGQAVLREDDVGRRAGSVRGARHRDAHVGTFQRRGVVDAVARHADLVAQLAEALHDEVLVLGEHLRSDDQGESGEREW